MSIGKRIKFFRNLRGLTQQKLGEQIGLVDNQRVRIAQYEISSRSPREDVLLALAKVLNVTPEAIEADVDDMNKVAHLLFALEEECGLKIKNDNGNVSLCLDTSNKCSSKLNKILKEWAEKSEMLESGLIKESDYNEWKYSFSIMEKKGE